MYPILSTEVIHVWKSDYAVNTNFSLPSFQRSVPWKGREGRRGKKKNSHGGKGIWVEGVRDKKITTWMDPSPSLLGSSVDDLQCFGRKQKLKIDCNFQFSIVRLLPKIEKLSHVTDCNIVGEAKFAAQFQFFSSLLTGLKWKYKSCFNILPKGKKVKNFRFGTSVFLWWKITKIKNWYLPLKYCSNQKCLVQLINTSSNIWFENFPLNLVVKEQ